MNLSIFASPFSRDSDPKYRRSQLRNFACAVAIMSGLLLTSASALAVSTVYTVNSNADTNTGTGTAGTLRYVIGQAADGDTIVFDNIVGTITLVNGPLAISHSITITGPGAGLLTISGNNASAMFTVSSGNVTVNGLTFAKGSSSGQPIPYGGAIFNQGTLTFNNCAFFNNTSGVNNGGAIYNTGVLTVNNSTFSGNSTTAGGGAIANEGTMTADGSTFSGNSATAGGAVFNNSGTATIENSTFTRNTIAGGGPGAGLFNGNRMFVENTTVANNLSGGGIWNNGSSAITLTNSIVTGNTGGDCLNCSTQSSNNIIGGTADLSPLQFNGGLTQTMIPLIGSPAIGAGSNSTLNTDQRGFARATSGPSDLGAVQTNYYTVTNLNDSGAGSLRQALTDAIASTGSSGDIVFQAGLTGTISLASALPEIDMNTHGVTSNINIEGPGANLLFISGNLVPSPNPVFAVTGSPSVVNLSGMTIEQGQSLPASGQPGGLYSDGLLTIENSQFQGNTGDTGGAVLNQGTLIVQNTTFANNGATNGGGGILNQRNLIAANDTFSANRADNTNGGGLYNDSIAAVQSSTFSGNQVLNGGTGGGIYNSSGQPLLLENSIVSGNTNVSTNTPDDCANCGTQSGTNLIGGTANLGALAYNGLNATTQTMIPLPGSVAIQGGDATQAPFSITTDQRGFPRLTNGKLDLGAVQTNYTSVNFVQQPTTTLLNATIAPAVTVNVLETNSNLSAPNNTDAVAGIPIALTFSGTGTLSGTLTQTTSAVATFNDLKVNAVGTGDELKTSLVVTGTQTLTATSNPFDVVLPTPTVSFNPALPAIVTYGVAPLTLKATTVNSSGQPTGQTVTFQVDSGPATVSGNVLTITGAGSVVVEVDAIANGTYGAADATSTIVVNKAALTVTAENTSRGYGAANPAFTGTYTGEVNGDTFTISGTTTATAISPVGTYPITPTAVGTHLADYNVTYVNGTLTVTKGTLTATAASMSRIYGTANPVFTGSLTGAVNGDTFVETFSTTAIISSNVGAYPIVPAVAGTNLADYTLVTVPGTLTVTQAASKMTLSASATQITPGTPVTLTANVTSTTTGIPTGTVIFMNGSTQLGTAPLNAQGVATLTVTTLPIGVNTITGIYSGDTNFTGSQAQLNQTIVVGTPAFTMTADPNALNITRGGTGVLTVTLTPTFGYTGTVTFNCTQLPLGSACHFQPASVTLDGTASAQVVVAIAIGSSADPANASSSSTTAWLRPLKPLKGLPILPAMFFWLPGTDWSLDSDQKTERSTKKRKSSRMLWIVALLALTAGALGIAGCSGLSPNYPPTGNTTINVVGLGSGGVNVSIPVNINIQ